jgi:hypothetical protein
VIAANGRVKIAASGVIVPAVIAPAVGLAYIAMQNAAVSAVIVARAAGHPVVDRRAVVPEAVPGAEQRKHAVHSVIVHHVSVQSRAVNGRNVGSV